MLVIRSRRVVLPDGVRAASIHIADGRIVRTAAHDEVPIYGQLIDVGGLAVSPGIVDSHVHINDPGRADWEGFESATRAAASGGVTMLVDMPLNSIPATTTRDGLRAKRAAAAARCQVDVAFWGGVVPGNAGELDGLIDDGVCGFKCFLVPSGVDEFPAVAEADLRQALPVLARRNVPLLVHAELPAFISLGGHTVPPLHDDDGGAGPRAGPRPRAGAYRDYLATRPREAEVEAIKLMVRLAEEFAVLTHIVHVSAAESVEALANAQAAGVPITGETCPHYLTFGQEDVPDGAVEFKCAPPIRSVADCEALWNGLRRGVLGLVVTDHSPAPPALKPAGDFMRAWGGIASLELALPVVWTGARARGFGLQDVAKWMSLAPAALAGQSDAKGAIAPGRDADLAIWDPEAEFVVDPCTLRQRHKITPYAGMRLHGMVHKTFVRGRLVWDRDRDRNRA